MSHLAVTQGEIEYTPVSACLNGRCDAKNCSSCGKQFGFFTPRHHCRSHEHSVSYCSSCGGVPIIGNYLNRILISFVTIHPLFDEQYSCTCCIQYSKSCSAICAGCSVGKDDERFCDKCDEGRTLQKFAFAKAIDAGVFSQGVVRGGVSRQSISSGSRRRLQEELSHFELEQEQLNHLQRYHPRHEICVVCDKTTCGGSCLRWLMQVTCCQICRQPVEQCETNGMCQQFMEAGEKCAYCAVAGCSEGCPRFAFQSDHLNVSDYLPRFVDGGGGGAAADSHPRQSFPKGKYSTRDGL